MTKITSDAQALAVLDSWVKFDDTGQLESIHAYLVRRLASTSPAPDAVGGWMPIEQAPRHMDVLVWVPGQCVDMRIAMLCDDRWLDTGCNRLRAAPTHWMTLPAAPQPVVEKDNG